MNIGFRILIAQEKHLRNDQICARIVDRPAEEDDAVLEQP
jgi:hypothetical protein